MCSHVFYNAKLNRKKEDYEFEEYVSNVGVGKINNNYQISERMGLEVVISYQAVGGIGVKIRSGLMDGVKLPYIFMKNVKAVTTSFMRYGTK